MTLHHMLCSKSINPLIYMTLWLEKKTITPSLLFEYWNTSLLVLSNHGHDLFINTKNLLRSNAKLLSLFLSNNWDAVHGIISYCKENPSTIFVKTGDNCNGIIPKLVKKKWWTRSGWLQQRYIISGI